MSEPQYCIRCDDHHNGDCDSGWISRTAALQARVREQERDLKAGYDDYRALIEENARLRKVVDAARDYAKWGASIGPNARKDWAALTDSLRELDGEKE